jgi:hypothetical protein
VKRWEFDVKPVNPTRNTIGLAVESFLNAALAGLGAP